MHKYLISIPWWIRKLFPHYTWSLKNSEQRVYLTFDDGPHPTITPWVLDELEKYNAKATFFCIGKNVAQHPRVYQRILDEGHSVGNHTHTHLDGWKTNPERYTKDVQQAAQYIDSRLFRPPYGKMTKSQFKAIREALSDEVDVIMWNVLSGDFDDSFSPQQCLRNVSRNARSGSIVVFHDSEKAYHNLFAVLPQALLYLTEKGFVLDKMGSEVTINN